jgi:hypothetical protein
MREEEQRINMPKKRVVTIHKMSLYDEDHHSFIFGLTVDELLKMMTSMTAQHYFEIHGKYPSRLDKTKISIRNRKA